MDSAEFWSVVDAARAEAGEVVNGFAARFVAALERRLRAVDRDELLDFDARRTELQARANSPAMWAAGRVVARYPDAFVDGLIARGREVYERAVADPDGLADDPVVRAAAEGRLDRHELAPTAVEDLAEDLYGDSEPDYPLLLRSRTGQVAGQASDDWDDANDDEVRRHLPRLTRLFAF